MKSSIIPVKSPTIPDFYALSKDNPIICNCYDSWKSKQLSLEQALELAVVELMKACNSFAEQFQSNYLASCDEMIDYPKYISDNVEYSPSLKMYYLARYYKTLVDLLATHKTCSTKISISFDNTVNEFRILP